MREICDAIAQTLTDELPLFWDGKESILFMRGHGCHNWKQMEWPGWFFQFRCETILSGYGFNIPGPAYGNVEFDGFYCNIPWDFKVHTDNAGQPKIPTNGYCEVMQALQEYGKVGFIVACGNAAFDDEARSFKTWHDALKGEISAYEQARIERGAPSRRRKMEFALSSLEFIFVDGNTIQTCGRFQAGMRNSNGTPRNPKVMLDLRNTTLERYSYIINPKPPVC